MLVRPRSPRPRWLIRAIALAGALALCSPAAAGAQVTPTRILDDPFANTTSQHRTVVEPDTYSFGSTIVAAAQVGRFFDGGASDIGFATSTNNGASWISGALPGITKFLGAGIYDRVSDPAVAYDARHGVWLVSSLALVETASGPSGRAVLTSRSADGVNWSNPVNTAVAKRGEDLDKNWIVCDNTPTSPFYGSCYTQFDDFGHGNALKMSYSRDGGLTWTASRVPRAGVIGGQPVVLPNGNVVVPLDSASESQLGYTVSTNGGVRFGSAFVITSITAADDPGNIRSGPLPSAEISGDGKIYVVWEDCRFRAACYTNDLVYVTSTNGTTWSAVQRIPIDSTTSTVDHFIPGVGVDKATFGANIHMGVTYYYYPNVNCTLDTCQLSVGYISSANGGSSWSAPTQLAGPMSMRWIADTSQGRMVGDYISTSFGSDGLAHPAFAVANPPTGSSTDCPLATPNCDEALYTAALAATGGTAVASDPVLFTGSTGNGKSAFRRR
jgi:hypothetical protein